MGQDQNKDVHTITVVGAGAMGTLLAHAFTQAGFEVTVIDRGRRLEQIQQDGLVVTNLAGQTTAQQPFLCTDRFRLDRAQDLVILATKAHDLPVIAQGVAKLLSSHTAVLTIQNGLPWWYFQGVAGCHANTRLTSVDPDGCLSACIPARHILGCVAYPAANLNDDGRVVHVEGDKFPIGELDNQESARCEQIAHVFAASGFRSRVLTDIRAELWLKAWGALSINPISALTRGTMSGICEHPQTRGLVAAMMQEAQDIAHALNIEFRHTIDKRIEGARAVGAHKTSMLQDLEAGRQLEIDALVGSVLELGEITGVPTPAIAAVHACVSLLDQNQRGL